MTKLVLCKCKFCHWEEEDDTITPHAITNTKSRKCAHLEEGEPPPKKIISEGDAIIKKLAKKQLEKNTTLSEQLTHNKDFVTSEDYVDITNHVSGENNLEQFKKYVTNINERNRYKSKNLSDRDIKMLDEYSRLGDHFWKKYKQINRDALTEYIQNIQYSLKKEDEKLDIEGVSSLSRHQQEYVNSLKPDSLETKLLKFASANEEKKAHLSGPIDELPSLEKQFSETIKEYTCNNFKKIQKKARSLGNKIKMLDDEIQRVPIANIKEKTNKGNKIDEGSLWDIQVKPVHNVKIICKSKKYTCSPQNWYTIKEGQIFKLNNIESKTDTNTFQPQTTFLKLTIDEIKNIPKFSNYEVGQASKILFVKNLPKNVDESVFKNVLNDFKENEYNIKIMKGKMNGQAFIEFEDENQSAKALDILNGIIIRNKPMVVQYGKKR